MKFFSLPAHRRGGGALSSLEVRQGTVIVFGSVSVRCGAGREPWIHSRSAIEDRTWGLWASDPPTVGDHRSSGIRRPQSGVTPAMTRRDFDPQNERGSRRLAGLWFGLWPGPPSGVDPGVRGSSGGTRRGFGVAPPSRVATGLVRRFDCDLSATHGQVGRECHEPHLKFRRRITRSVGGSTSPSQGGHVVHAPVRPFRRIGVAARPVPIRRGRRLVLAGLCRGHVLPQNDGGAASAVLFGGLRVAEWYRDPCIARWFNSMASQPFPENSHEVRESIRAGRDADAVNRVMETYHAALLSCLRRSRYGRQFRGCTVNTDEDVVQNFMTLRVGREDFLREWTTRPGRLRYYLLRAFMHFLQWEQRKVDRRRCGSLLDNDAPADPCPDVALEFDQDLARTIVKHAYQSVQERALREGKSAYFEAFRRKYFGDRTHRQIEEEVSGVDRNVSHMVRTIQGWFIAEIRDRVGRPGNSLEDITRAIRELLESLR